MKRNRKTISIFLSTFICLIWLTAVPVARAATPVVSPAEGTKGTAFTISGSDFGEKAGRVFIGFGQCTVLRWSDTLIQCRIGKSMPAGEYDLVIRPKRRKDAVILPDAFEIRAPKLDLPMARPHFVSPGDTMTVTGDFFGEGISHRKVKIRDNEGDIQKCRILDWTMNEITFRLPDTKKISGRFSLIIKNRMGTDVQHVWGTFADAPQNPPNLVGSTHSGTETADIASAVYFQNKYWVFWPDKDNSGNHLKYQIWDGGSNWSGANSIVINDQIIKSKTVACPIVVGNSLYVFFTELSGYAHFVIYNPLAGTEDKGWQGEFYVPGVKMHDGDCRFAAAYHSIHKTIEVYWSDGSNINMTFLDLEAWAWCASKTLPIQKNPSAPSSPLALGVDAIANQTGDGGYVTYLTWADNGCGYLTELKDGEFLCQSRSEYWRPANKMDAPSVVDLGEDQLAIIYNRMKNRDHYCKYDKINHTPISGEIGVPFTGAENGSWNAEGLVVSTKVSDDNAYTGYRMESHFYAFVENNPTWDEANWEVVQCEYLGYWKPTGPVTYVDFQGSDLLTQEEREERISQTFPLWPMIGMVDMPPFVENGQGVCEDLVNCATSVELSFTTANTEGLSGEYSIGAYLETGKKSPVTADVGAGYAGGFENSKTYTFTQTGGIHGNEEGRIFAYYLVPAFNVCQLEWYDLSGKATEIYTQSLELVDASIRRETFEPEAGPVMSTLPTPYLNPEEFPVHGYEDDGERLSSYALDPTTAAEPPFRTVLQPEQVVWGVDSPASFKWEITEEQSVDSGFYVDCKIGAEVAGVIGFGVEGSFSMMINTTTQYGVEAITTLKNRGPDPENPISNPVTEFSVKGFWLKPDPNGYWVPENRKGLGDAPWFITYQVMDYWQED
jgi:hypothetical protein